MQAPDRRRSLWLPAYLAFATLTLIVVRALVTVDPDWDTLAYHWPFAARAAGLCDRACFTLTPGMEYRYEGFPMLLHTAQGYVWRVTGTPGMADLLSIASVLVLCAYLRWRFAVPLAWSWLAFLAIPIVQIQLTSSYIDLPVNAALALALLVTLRMMVDPDADSRADVAIALVALGVAAGGKYQMVPVALAVWAAIMVLCVRRPAALGLPRRSHVLWALGLAGIAVLVPKLVMNAVAFGNPFHPLALAVGPFRFAGPEPVFQTNSVSEAWLRRPAAMRWLASVLEFQAFNGRPLPWTIGQGDVPQASPSFRMGGYFVPYVLGAVMLLGWAARTTRNARWAAAWMIALSVACALMPGSHELRYYLFWMLALASSVLVIAHAPTFAGTHQDPQRTYAHALVAISTSSVILMTGAHYLRYNAVTLQDIVRSTEQAVAAVPDGGTLCVRDKDHRAILYSAVFHRPRDYRTRVLDVGASESGCTTTVTPDP